MCKRLFNQIIVPRIQNTQQECFRILFSRIEPFGSFCKLQTFQTNHFVPLLRLFKNSVENQGTRTMDAKRVHVSVPKMENSLSFKHCRLEFPKSTFFYVVAVTLLLVIHLLPPLFYLQFLLKSCFL